MRNGFVWQGVVRRGEAWNFKGVVMDLIQGGQGRSSGEVCFGAKAWAICVLLSLAFAFGCKATQTVKNATDPKGQLQNMSQGNK